MQFDFFNHSPLDATREAIVTTAELQFHNRMPLEFFLNQKWTHIVTEDEFVEAVMERSYALGWGPMDQKAFGDQRKSRLRADWYMRALSEGRTADDILRQREEHANTRVRPGN